MSDDVVISVRGDATAVVEPDLATLTCVVRTSAPDKAQALASAADALRAAEADLAALGGVAATADNRRVPLSWVAASASSQEETYFDRHTEERRPTGQVLAKVNVQVRVRDLQLLAAVGSALAGHDRFHLVWVNWQVDDDNPAWSRVRADAIRAALQRARDYASALGGSVSSVEQIADSGLLSDGGQEQGRAIRARSLGFGGSDDDSPPLDAEPQELSAVIEARVIASVPELAL